MLHDDTRHTDHRQPAATDADGAGRPAAEYLRHEDAGDGHDEADPVGSVLSADREGRAGNPPSWEPDAAAGLAGASADKRAATAGRAATASETEPNRGRPRFTRRRSGCPQRQQPQAQREAAFRQRLD